MPASEERRDLLGGWMAGEGWREGRNAPQEPQAPPSGPDGGSRGSHETAGGRTEAQEAWLFAALMGVPGVQDVGLATSRLLPAVTAYGDQREKAGAENALREAAGSVDLRDPADDPEDRWWRGFRAAMRTARRALEARATEIGGRT